jgi:hypothetical protein
MSARMRTELTAREERFCQLVGARLMDPGPAMIEVGYSKGTVGSRGPAYLLSRPRVQARIRQVQDQVAGQAVSTLQDVFLMIKDDLGLAFKVERGLMEKGESETVRERAARTIIETGKGLLIAAMPGKKAFEVVMRDAYKRAQERLEAGEVIEAEGGAIAGPNRG